MFKSWLKKLRHRVVLYVFNYYFGEMIYSFESADDKINKMTETEKGYYYRAVADWKNSSAYKIEYLGEYQDIFRKIAQEAVTDDILTALRLCLLREKNRDLRLDMKVKEFELNQATLKSFKTIN